MTDPRELSKAQTQTVAKQKTKQPWLWNVVLIDDSEHTFPYVIRMAQEVFSLNEDRARALAETVNNNGRAICVTTHKEHAELKVEQVISFGKDPLLATCKGPMSCVIEPAEVADDSADGK